MITKRKRARAATSPVLTVSDLRIVRNGTAIVAGISWQVEPGQHWVILGANGSGKTSLLSALTGYLMPSAGEVAVLGEPYGASDWRELRTRIGLVGASSIRQLMHDEEPALDTVISGKHAVIGWWGRRNQRDETDARQILRQIGCSHLARRPWAVLSQGERQRILIGRALIARPALLILDEPCAGLDPVVRETFLAFLTRLAQRRVTPTLLFVTHHVEEIVPGFTHLLLLKQGRVLGSGPIASVLRQERLTDAFGGHLKLGKRDGRYTLAPDRGRRTARQK